MRFLFGSFVFLTLVVGFSVGGMSAQPERPAPVPVRDIESGGIVGHLGKPLGQVVRVEGTIVDGNTPMAPKDTAYRVFLKAEVISGMKLEQPTMVAIRDEDKARLTPGKHVTLIGWETGKCRGNLNDPDHLLRVGGFPVAAPQFGFRSEFVVGEIVQ